MTVTTTDIVPTALLSAETRSVPTAEDGHQHQVQQQQPQQQTFAAQIIINPHQLSANNAHQVRND